MHTKHLDNLARRLKIEGLSSPSLEALSHRQKGYDLDRARCFLAFQDRIEHELLQHRVITDNAYCHWFAQGELNPRQVKAFIIQFSVFSNQFLLAQLNKMINADSLETMRASKEILANELGVRFKVEHRDKAIDVAADMEGSVEGSIFHFASGHFEWLYHIALELGLEFADIGRRRHGNDSTLFFCDQLIHYYGGEDYMISQAASYAVENWAAAGFWKQLIRGFRKFNRGHDMKLPLGFFIWHDRIESQHASHTQEELEALYFNRVIDEDSFIHYGNEMLDAVAAFWDGLEQQRRYLGKVH